MGGTSTQLTRIAPVEEVGVSAALMVEQSAPMEVSSMLSSPASGATASSICGASAIYNRIGMAAARLAEAFAITA